ncbi:MAG: YcjF family protein [Gemmataceae bacterium]
MLDRLKRLFSASVRQARLQEHLERLRHKMPVPVFWLYGKTQSGKTSIIKFLTGAEQAEIGKGFQACTRFSRKYEFPTEEAPLLTFLDTRGLDEAGYDPTEDLARFNESAHVLIVTVKALDHAQENVLRHLRTIRRAKPTRPVVLVLTCLHEAYPQQQHPLPNPFTAGGEWNADPPALLADLTRSLAEQRQRFTGLVDRVVAVDLTPAEEGFNDPDYGGSLLRQALLEMLPAAFRQTLLSLGEAGRELQDFFARQALPHILAYSTLAGSAAAVPAPVVDLILLSAIQSRMVYHLARLYGQPLTAQRFLEIASTLGMGLLLRQGTRMMLKFIPYIGPSLGAVASGTLAGASTFALGKAFCFYYQSVHQGHIPKTEELRRYYREQLALAEQAWKNKP